MFPASSVVALERTGRSDVQRVQGIVTPWSDSSEALASVVFADAVDVDVERPPSRLEALRVPAVAAARGIILSSLAPAPLRALKGDEVVPLQPTWLYRTNSVMGPTQRMMHTLDDHLFYGNALWAITRGADGMPLDAQYVQRSLWRLTDAGQIELADSSVRGGWRLADTGPRGEVVYLPAAFEGLLAVAADTIRGALDLEQSWRTQAATPLPGIILQETEDNGMTPEEMRAWVDEVASARRKRNGAVIGVPATITATVAAAGDPALLVEGRNAVKLDVAGFTNLNPAMLGAALPKASLNYETQEGTRSEFTERLSFWTSLLEDRLSLDDLVPAGTRVRFDLNPTPDPAAASTGPTVED